MNKIITIILAFTLLVPVARASQTEFLINKYRATHGLHELIQSDYLDSLAHERACWLNSDWNKVKTYYQRTCNAGDCRHLGFASFAKSNKIRGENLAYKYNWLDTLRAWIKSPTHNDNLLGDYSLIGLGECRKIKVLLLQ